MIIFPLCNSFMFYSSQSDSGRSDALLTEPSEKPVSSVEHCDKTAPPDPGPQPPPDKEERSEETQQPPDEDPVYCRIVSVAVSEIFRLNGSPLGGFVTEPDPAGSGEKKTEGVVLLVIDNKFRLLSPADGVLYGKHDLSKGKITARVYDLTNRSSKELLAAINCCADPSAHYLDQAAGYATILKETGLAQKDLTSWFDLSQSAVSNRMRLLGLGELVKNEVRRNHLTERHCRALLHVDTEEMQLYVLRQIVSGEISSRRIEQLAKQLSNKTVSDLGPESYLAMVRTALFSPPVDSVKERRAFLSALTKIITNYRRTGAQVYVKSQETDDAFDVFLRISKKNSPTP